MLIFGIMKKLTALLFIAGLVPLLMVGFFVIVEFEDAMRDQAMKQLISLRESRKS